MDHQVMFGSSSHISTFFLNSIICSIEYITTLSVTSGNDNHFAPSSITIEGCSESGCIVLGKQDLIIWDGAYETHSIIINEGKQSFSLFHILFGRTLTLSSYL